eukprot:TRINITY_DN3626_c0_g2_i1.p1 TRINITY_DN3626_c0_g2~~TRINITY_DN3626_c0_g2_i1.p1  ORF type:complete len:220 (+),score=40.46 TRINITY_DN3626_c0_g2_i1:53-712(+)
MGYDKIDEKGIIQQPSAPSGVGVQHVVGQPVVLVQQPKVEWNIGLFDCFQDCGICCDVCWCGLCIMSRQCESIVNNNQDTFNVPLCCGLWLAQVFIGAASTCLFTWVLRDKARHKYNIEGDGCSDCCAVTFCGACVVCQLQRETLSRGDNPGYCCCNPSNPPVVVAGGAPAQPGYVPAQPGYVPQQPVYQQGYGTQQPVAYPQPPPAVAYPQPAPAPAV